jgi:hypothetical protein
MAVTAFMYPMMLSTTWNKEADIDTDTIKCALSNTAYTYAATHKYFDATPFTTAWTELSTANGYTAGGVALTSPTITNGQTTSWTAGNAVWTASGAGISATSAVVYDSTPGAGVKPLISYVLFGGTATAPAGATLTIAWNASGIISVVVA